MFSNIMIGTNDVQKAKAFYDATLGSLGYKPGVIDENGRCFYIAKTDIFAITKPIDGKSACHANGGTIGFTAKSSEEVNAWHAIGLGKGGVACEAPPGMRESVVGKFYTAYLRDPDGNKICAVHQVK